MKQLEAASELTTRIDAADVAAKRIVDVVVALAVLVGFSPLWLLITVLIKLTSPGPALYSGQVVGRGGMPFTYYKFRTMRAGLGEANHRRFIEQYVRGEARHLNGSEQGRGHFKAPGEDRITPVGRILRRVSLDEIPQFINVLRGEMSVVGPRPPVLYEYELYDDWARQRLAVRPGVTGLAQVRRRSAATFQEMVRLDLE
jgi:lipopolysaccharide/colanic/teichoic acid biosynthesis glycosyltransferase